MIKSNATPSGFGSRQHPWHFIVLISITVKCCWQGLWKASWAVKLHWKLLDSEGLFLTGSVSISRSPWHGLQQFQCSLLPQADSLHPWDRDGGRAKQEAKSQKHLKNNQSCCTNHTPLHLSSKHMVGICSSHILQIIKVLFNLQKNHKKKDKKNPTHNKNHPRTSACFWKVQDCFPFHCIYYFIIHESYNKFCITFSDQQFFLA